MPVTTESVDIRVIGGPTTVIEIGGLRVLTDPTFDGVRDYDAGPRPGAEQDPGAPPSAPTSSGPSTWSCSPTTSTPTTSTSPAAPTSPTRRSSSRPRVRPPTWASLRVACSPWDSVDVPRPDGSRLSVTATPAQHGPEGCEPVTGEVTGFLLAGDGVPTVYVSGDNASLDVVRAIAERVGNVDTALIFAGAARTPFFDGALVTLDSAGAARGRRDPWCPPCGGRAHRQLGALHRGPRGRREAFDVGRPGRPAPTRLSQPAIKE